MQFRAIPQMNGAAKLMDSEFKSWHVVHTHERTKFSSAYCGTVFLKMAFSISQ